MRIHFPSTRAPKVAAKIIVREAKKRVSHSSALEAIAKVTGYRDWHELNNSIASDRSNPTLILEKIKYVVLSIADVLDIDHADVEFALVRSRLIPRITLDEALGLRASIWRDRLFGPPARGKPGTVIRVKEPGRLRTAYLLSLGRPTHVFYDTGFGGCADFEAVTPRVPLPDFVPSRLWLPYGYWTVGDGAIITFSRDYMPLWRTMEGVSTRLDPWERIPDIRARNIFIELTGTGAWSAGPARELALAHLKDLGIVGLPRLVDAMAYTTNPVATSIDEAVSRMRGAHEALAA